MSMLSTSRQGGSYIDAHKYDNRFFSWTSGSVYWTNEVPKHTSKTLPYCHEYLLPTQFV